MNNRHIQSASGDLPVALVAGLIGDPARSAMLLALLDGKALPAGELARRAHVTPQTASAHLSKLLEGNLLAVEQNGRHRYFRLAGSEVAHALEALAALSPELDNHGELPADPRKETLRFARTCYDHLAGKLAVALANSLQEKGVLQLRASSEFLVSTDGEALFGGWGIDIAGLRQSNRAFARPCLDWTERRHHVAGALGAEILKRMLTSGWIARVSGSRRVILTEMGRMELRERLGLRISGDAIHGYTD